jgi:acetyl-CoA synthetase
MLLGIHRDPERYRGAYWSRFPGVYYTGDYAVRDKDGYFWILGRADDVLKVAGHRIGTAELEDAAISHPQVAEAAVVGKEDPVKGESIVIFARLKEGVAPSPDLKKDLASHIRRVLGPIAVPDEVYFVAKLPKTRSGTVMRRVLKAVANNTSIGDLTTLEDESSVEEIIKAYQELKKGEVKKK